MIGHVHRQRGFTLLEIMVALAIVALICGIALPSYYAMMHRGQVNQQIRHVLDDLAYARQVAGAGNQMTSSRTDNVRSASFRILSNTQYEIVTNSGPSGTGSASDIIRVV